MIHEHDTVVLSKDIDEYGLKQGDIGAIVHTYEDAKTYEVEFVTGEGRTVAVVTLSDKDVRSMDAGEILHTRVIRAA